MQNWLRFVILTWHSISVGVLAIELCWPTHIGGQFCSCRVDRMCDLPKACCNGQRIDSLLVPPEAFIAAPVKLAMMKPANRNGEPVADLPAHGPLLGKFEVMRI